MQISVISPVYMAEKIVPELVKRISEELRLISTDFEIILVDDCGPDNSWKEIKKQCKKYKFVKGIKLSRNFGQHYAVSAGIAKATGDNIVLMDCDLQDNPRDIHKLLEKRNEGYEVVFTERIKRKHSALKTIIAFIYNKLFTLFSGGDYHINAGSLVLFSKRVGLEFNKLEDKDRLYLQMLKWIGFKSTVVAVNHDKRLEGKSSYNFIKLLKIGIQGWTSHSDKLLKFSVYLGTILSFVSFIAGILIIIKYFFYNLQPGWPSIIVTILFSTGLILLSVGVMGLYIGKIFEQSKNRPLYIIDEEINVND
ncbi:glycosyltransferase family 2 protein [Flavivirga sp. 57AJ16]|uniref:glycosyltransferase family 2 protein n=1 Tax=Flavivirga sp. 57AJ16 TaxID=3025307 RepID=UPI002364FF89|nr:glycosyltransferase [Flavivirga sp. 57AJ16]MDD7885176.1 glycosyltransferase [Flavivirga sp. 57AJ16]